MLHLEVDGCVQGSQGNRVVQIQKRGVHEVQQEGEAFGVHFGVQADGTKACVLRFHEHRVEEATVRR